MYIPLDVTKITNTYKLKDKLLLLKLIVGERLFFKRGQSKYEDDQTIINNEKRRTCWLCSRSEFLYVFKINGYWQNVFRYYKEYKLYF